MHCILGIAESYGSPLGHAGSTPPVFRAPSGPRNASPGVLESCLVKIVLEMKVLELLSTSIEMAQGEIKTGRLLPSAPVKNSKYVRSVLLALLYRHYFKAFIKCHCLLIEQQAVMLSVLWTC